MSLWAKYKIQLWAEVGGVIYNDVVQFSSTFAMNEIPTGSIMLAVGRNVRSLQPATIHQAAVEAQLLGDALLQFKTPAKVYLKLTPQGSAGVPNDQEREFIIFDGYAVGTGWRRNRGEAQFVIHLLHWLDDLNASSMLSATSHPTSPADFAFSAVFPALGINTTGGVDPSKIEPSWTATCDATAAIGDTQLQTDLWGRVLYPWLETIAKQDRLNFNPPGGGGISQGLNDRALKALQRMAPGSSVGCKVTPLAMDLSGADGAVVANGVRAYLERETFSSWVHTTFWGKLIGAWGPEFMFSLVPRIEDAFPVPFTGPLRDTHIIIGPRDYDYANILSPMSQVLQGIGVVHPTQHNAGGNMSPGENQAGFSQLCGWYTPPGDHEGLLLFKQPPGWITEVIPEYASSRDSAGAEGDPIGTASDPGTGKGPTTITPTEAINAVASTSFMNRYAQQWYALETIKGRQGEMSGKLRFDIAPGSSISIIPAREKFIIGGGSPSAGLPYFATVTRVSTTLNSETQQAGTGFGLAHVRSGLENKSDKTSVAKPPLYQAGWKGCALSAAF
jgi:hypothetical protein